MPLIRNLNQGGSHLPVPTYHQLGKTKRKMKKMTSYSNLGMSKLFPYVMVYTMGFMPWKQTFLQKILIIFSFEKSWNVLKFCYSSKKVMKHKHFFVNFLLFQLLTLATNKRNIGIFSNQAYCSQ